MTDKIRRESTGQPAVIGHRDVLTKYHYLPWEDVLAAGERGDDGLRVAAIGSPEFNVQADEFALRAITTLSRGVQTGLFRQRW